MAPALTIGLLWLLFAVTHVGLSSIRLRGSLVESLGSTPFLALYSLVALAIFIPLVATYFGNKHVGPQLWVLGSGPLLRGTVYLLMTLAFVFVTASLANPSPAGVVPGDATPRGIYRITRHPLLMGLSVFALAHLLPNSTRSDLAFFGGFVMFSLVGARHQDRRKLADGPSGFGAFHAATPFLPFTGKEPLAGLRDLSPFVVSAAIAVTIVLRYFHRSLFGP